MSEHYFSENPSSEIREKNYNYTIKNATLALTAVSGVFAFEPRVDKVSELLISNFSPSGLSVLDVGCGYGAIGLFIKALFPDQKLVMIDVNNRALEYSRLNARQTHLDVEVLGSDLYSSLEGILFDDIVSNPPFAAGKELNRKLIGQAPMHLNPGGSLWLVAHHNKGGSTLKDIMTEVFGNAEDVEKSGGVRVYRSVRQPI